MSDSPIPPLDYAGPPPRRRRVLQVTLVAVVGLGVIGSLLALALFGVSTVTTVNTPAVLMPTSMPTTTPTTLPTSAGQ